jgi:GT2 family glycosyltransferase
LPARRDCAPRTEGEGALPVPARLVCIVANWNRRAALLRCLEGLVHRVRVPAGIVRDVLVVDNGSSDGSREAVAARFPEVRVLNTGANLGGSGAFRLGLAWAIERPYDYVWLLDNDAYPSRRILQCYVDAVQRLGPGVVLGGTMHMAEAPRLIHEAGGLFARDDRLGIQLPLHGHRSTLRLRTGRPPEDVDYVAFANLFAPVSVIRSIGLPADLFLHYDDVEFGLRARRAGFRMVNLAEAIFWHESGQAKPPTWVHYYDTRNSLHAIERLGPKAFRRRRRLVLASALRHLLAGRPAVTRLVLQGVRDHARGITGRADPDSRGISVTDVRRTDPVALLEAYRCRFLVVDWDSLAALLPCYRRAWAEFLARSGDRAYLGLDTARGVRLFPLATAGNLPRGADIAPGSGSLDGRRRGHVLRRSLYVRSRDRSGLVARARFAVCRARLILHGSHVIDYNRLGRGEAAMALIDWITTTLVVLGRGTSMSRDATAAREASNA